jgi:hypothetical protein
MRFRLGAVHGHPSVNHYAVDALKRPRQHAYQRLTIGWSFPDKIDTHTH